MGLLLSILVVCVGVLEVIASIRHIQDGYLPVWTPHHAATTSGLRSLHEHWRKKTNEEDGDNNKRGSCSGGDGYATSQQSNTLLQSSSVSNDSSSVVTATADGLAEHGRNLPIEAENGDAVSPLGGESKDEWRSSEPVEPNEHIIKEVNGEECVTPTRSECNEQIEACGQDGDAPSASEISSEQQSGIQEADGPASRVVTCLDHTASHQQSSHQSSQVNVAGDGNVNQQLREDEFLSQEVVAQPQDVAADDDAYLDKPPSPKTAFPSEDLDTGSNTEDRAEDAKAEDSLIPSENSGVVPEEDRVQETKSEGSLTPSDSSGIAGDSIIPSESSGVVPEQDRVQGTKAGGSLIPSQTSAVVQEEDRVQETNSEGSLTPSESCVDVQEASKGIETEDAVPDIRRKDVAHPCKEVASFDEDVQELRSLLRKDSKLPRPVEAEIESQGTHEKALSSEEEADTSDPEDRDALKLPILTPRPVLPLPSMSSPGTPRKSRTDISWPTFCPTTPVIKRPSIPLITSESMSIDKPRFTHRHSEGDTSINLQEHPEIAAFSSQSSENPLPEASKDDTVSESAHCEPLFKDSGSIQPTRQTLGDPVCKEGISVLSRGITETPIKSSIKEKFRHRDSNDDVSTFSRSQEDDNDASISGDSFDVDGSEVSSSDISMKNEFSRKEMGIRRRRSYRKKRQTSSTESLTRSEEEEADDRSFGDNRAPSKFAVTSKEPRRQFHKPSKAMSLENVSSQDFSDRRVGRKQHTSFDDHEETEDVRRRNVAGDDDVFEEDVVPEEPESSSSPLVGVKTEDTSETTSTGIPKSNVEKNVSSREAVGTKSESPKAIGQGKEAKTVECVRVTPVGSEIRIDESASLDQGRDEDGEDSTVSDSSSLSQAKSAPKEAFWVSSQAEPVPKE